MIGVVFYFVGVIILGTTSSGLETTNDALTILVILFVSIGCIISINNSKKLSAFTQPMTLGLFMRVFLVLFDTYGRSIYQVPNMIGDSGMYKAMAIQFSQGGSAGRGEVFSQVIGTLMKVTGPNVLFAQYSISLLSIITLCIIAKTLLLFEEIDFSVKYRTVTIVSLLPNFAIVSSAFLRESIIAMFISLSFYIFVRWMRSGRFIIFIISCATALCAALFHGGSAAIVVGYIGAYMIYDHDNQVVSVKSKNVLPVIGFVFIFSFLFFRFSNTFFSKINTIDSISEIANVSTEGGSSYAQFVGNSNSILSMIVYTVPRIVYFLCSPFPWQWRNIGDVIAFVFSSLFYLITLKNVITRLRHHYLSDYIYIVFFVAMATTFVFAWGVSNTGTAARHREKMIIIYALLYALGRQSKYYTATNSAINEVR